MSASSDALVVLCQRLAEEDRLLARLRQGALTRPPLKVAVHCQEVEAVYADACRAYAERRADGQGMVAEERFLYAALRQLGFERPQ